MEGKRLHRLSLHALSNMRSESLDPPPCYIRDTGEGKNVSYERRKSWGYLRLDLPLQPTSMVPWLWEHMIVLHGLFPSTGGTHTIDTEGRENVSFENKRNIPGSTFQPESLTSVILAHYCAQEAFGVTPTATPCAPGRAERGRGPWAAAGREGGGYGKREQTHVLPWHHSYPWEGSPADRSSRSIDVYLSISLSDSEIDLHIDRWIRQ